MQAWKTMLQKATLGCLMLLAVAPSAAHAGRPPTPVRVSPVVVREVSGRIPEKWQCRYNSLFYKVI